MKLEYIENGAPDTPLVRLYDFDVDAAARLRQLVLQLAAGSAHALLLHAVDGVEPISDCRLTCAVGARDDGVRRNKSEFTCVLTAETWTQVADLIEPFCRRADAGRFQYLVEAGDITLLLSVDSGW
jgi:hypothetical protein